MAKTGVGFFHSMTYLSPRLEKQFESRQVLKPFSFLVNCELEFTFTLLFENFKMLECMHAVGMGRGYTLAKFFSAPAF